MHCMCSNKAPGSIVRDFPVVLLGIVCVQIRLVSPLSEILPFCRYTLCVFKLGIARDFASVMLMYEEREGKWETGARKVEGWRGGGEEGVMSLFYARILYLYIYSSPINMLRWERHKETRETETARYTDTVFFSRRDEADSFTTIARVPRRARKLAPAVNWSVHSLCQSRYHNARASGLPQEWCAYFGDGAMQ